LCLADGVQSRKYLRVPDFLIRVLEKQCNKKIGDFTQIRYELKTGAEKFFYIPNTEMDIKVERKFLLPLLSSPK
ncbi:MAG: hypothetical protein ACUVUQ_11505, partial [Thermodesulfovibrionales bacterium]